MYYKKPLRCWWWRHAFVSGRQASVQSRPWRLRTNSPHFKAPRVRGRLALWLGRKLLKDQSGENMIYMVHRCTVWCQRSPWQSIWSSLFWGMEAPTCQLCCSCSAVSFYIGNIYSYLCSSLHVILFAGLPRTKPETPQSCTVRLSQTRTSCRFSAFMLNYNQSLVS